ncbi:ribosome maturation factor RimM [Paenibacillus chitinolyticus]|uniref:Ribosome maturation factor RimM n=1 Tax=Paenibacillus chitinolyticus TaxID=79263 RepID=A0A410X0D4_9BACL|nr:ribosome maturation factor RimM [Paenibacillus chitinolyticus]MCY9588412.1 ribosome maturation factor RimM [Paenibacillus chitinolyticus]MCY9597782.1 ribosome maturation factor RimM [Paenibacillus chitinolyticus]QAV20165.1 ribosome maturation factor RimM [Paenibacillus chitinolyticus]
MSDKLYTVGTIVNTHGLRGEVKVVPHTDFAEQRFANGSKLVIEDAKGKLTPVTIKSTRLHKNMYIAQFKEFSHINEVEVFKSSLLRVEEKYLESLDEDEYYYHEILGCRVLTEEGEELGTIEEILTPGANHVWVVGRPNKKQLLLPVIDDVVLDVNVEEKIVTVHLLEGLLDL